MSASMAFVLDVILAAVLLGVILKAWKAGFVSAFISLVGTLAGYLGAAILSAPISRWLYQSFARERVLDYVAERLPTEVGGVPLDSVEQFAQLGEFKDQVIDYLSQALEAMGLDWGLLGGGEATGADAAHAVYSQVAGGSASVAEALTDVVVGPAVELLLRIAVFFVLFVLIMAVVRLLVKLGHGFNHVPLVGSFNRLLGLGLGLGQAVVMGTVAAMVLVLIAAVTGNRWELVNSRVLAETRLIQWFRELDLLSLL